MTTWRVILGDTIDGMRTLPDGSVHCCVTSPPYWGLRDYGVDGQIGLEPTPAEYIARMVDVFREVRRVLREDGTCWVNMGDCYVSQPNQRGVDDLTGTKQATNTGSRSAPSRSLDDLPPKNLVGMPWRLAFALQADGWWLRSDIIWAKPNPMPESVTDRPTKSHEYLFLLTKAARYYYDAEAVKEAPSENTHRRAAVGGKPSMNVKMAVAGSGTKNNDSFQAAMLDLPPGTPRNLRTVWTIPTQAFPGAHFATFPEKLVEPCIKAGSPAGGMVLDPFTGSGTTGEVAVKLGRSFVGCELNPEYHAMARERIGGAMPLVAREVA